MAPAFPRAVTDADVEERKREILRAAVGAITERGVEAARLRDIARIAGVSIGTLQHHFESRDALIDEAFRLGLDEVLAGWDEGDGQLPPFERIAATVTHLTETESFWERCRLWVEFASSASRHPETRTEFLRIYDQWGAIFRGAIEEGRADGTFAPLLEDAVITEILLEQIDGSVLAVAAGLGRVDAMHMRETTLKLAAVLLGYRDRVGA